MDGSRRAQSFTVLAQYIDYNGERLYYRQELLYSIIMLCADIRSVSFFAGSRDIGSLDVQPLSDDASLKQTLKEHGLQFLSLKGRHYKEYEGEIIQQDPKSSIPLPPMPPGIGSPSQQNRSQLRFQVSKS